jgi:hypothetical protein
MRGRVINWVFVDAVVVVLIALAVTIWAWFAPQPERAVAAATAAVAVATLGLAGATLYLASVALKEMEEGRQSAQETIRALQRPLLVPVGTFGLDPWPDAANFWGVPDRHLLIANVGSGVGTNVRGVLLTRSDAVPYRGPVFSIDFGRPLAKGQEETLLFKTGGILVPMSANIAGVSLFARPDPFYFLRLTLTYWDIFGSKHVSIFDLNQNQGWEQVHISEASQDLSDIDENSALSP